MSKHPADSFQIRPATVDDVAAMFQVRLAVTENRMTRDALAAAPRCTLAGFLLHCADGSVHRPTNYSHRRTAGGIARGRASMQPTLEVGFPSLGFPSRRWNEHHPSA